jgi:hypothetical protein
VCKIEQDITLYQIEITNNKEELFANYVEKNNIQKQD